MILIALGSLLLNASASADDTPKLPSRKAAVVIPILSPLSAKSDSEKDVLLELDRILGNYDTIEASRHNDQVQKFYSYRLERGTKIVAIFLDARLVMIRAPTQSDPDRVIYPHPAPE